MPSFEEQAMERAGRLSRGRRENPPAPQPPEPAKKEEPAAKKTTEAPTVSLPPQATQPAPNMLETLFQNKENSLIMMLLLLLMDEKSDPSLIFALMYLLM